MINNFLPNFDELYYNTRSELEGRKDYKDLDTNDIVAAMVSEALKYDSVGAFRADGGLTEKAGCYVAGFWAAVELIAFVQNVDSADVENAIDEWIHHHDDMYGREEQQ